MSETFANRVLAESRMDQPFRPIVAYDRDGDCVEFIACPDAYYAERVDGWVTVYYSETSGEIIGSEIKGVSKLLQQHPGLDIEIRDGSVALQHLLRAHAWSTKPDDSVTVMRYQKMIELAETAHAELELLEAG